MGKACTNTFERINASLTGKPCAVTFSSQIDLSRAGVLFSLPSLLSNGLLNKSDNFNNQRGYYSIESTFLCLAFLCLLRIKTLAQSAMIPTGELGRALGLDRIPNVKKMREMIAFYADSGQVENWALGLSKGWMEDNPDLSGILYIDGHVGLYYGYQTKMPKRFVSRLRLCMNGSTDYYVNDRTGQPFFVVNKELNSSMIETIKNEIIPQLNKDVPNQPNITQTIANPLLCRYMLVFDRECSSYGFFGELWIEKIAICTYRKNVKDYWDETEFSDYEELSPDGTKIKEKLAERGVFHQYKKNNEETGQTEIKSIWLREIRKRCESGHQTSIITTNYLLPITLIGLYMFARWSQENFFKYMIENFGIDALVSYSKEKISDTTVLINPQYRKLESELKKLTSKITIRNSKFGLMTLEEHAVSDENMSRYMKKKTNLKEEIEMLTIDKNALKEKLAKIQKKIKYADLPENEKFTNAINQRKHFLDTIKMISYRAETAMANSIKNKMSHPNEARLLLKRIYNSDANINPDYEKNILIIELHKLNTWKEDEIAQNLCQILNETETIFPGTNLTLFYKLVSN